ncbi:Voltage-gated potassium channel Kch [Posidoniimonas polymericola]|uniref:Voltage-gated potassium channel Kch n=1 Tax=Posidoniimonas polymericola TaxID=2528002 RepID=A0A5C5YEM1_9BACT|nr:potassium channel protein [Posidoniimonas polymericola]TWT72755.1 Voltage-gated potassium channel Kch [Posidoniimonas polymericola]
METPPPSTPPAAWQRTPISGPIRKIITGLALFLAICLIAVTGYVASGWQLDDSIYMVIITIFGVGYGEIQPVDSPAERALTILVIIAGYGAVIYTVGGFMQMLIDGELNKALGARRMTKDIQRLEGHTILCGAGRVGTILAQELLAGGKPFVLIDSDAVRLQEAQDRGYLVVSGDATEEFVLQQAGIERASVLATVLSQDANNVFVTITAREMNPNLTIIARGENPRTEKKLLGCGANKVVLPTAIGAKKLAQMIIRPSAENILDQLTTQSDMGEELGRIGLRFEELEVTADSAIDGKRLADIELRGNHGFLIVGIRQADGATTLHPPDSTQLAAGDVVIILGHGDEMPELASRFKSKRDKMTYRGVTIDAN